MRANTSVNLDKNRINKLLSSLKTDTNPVLPYSFLNLKKLNGTPLKFSVRYLKGSARGQGICLFSVFQFMPDFHMIYEVAFFLSILIHEAFPCVGSSTLSLCLKSSKH